jgi:hypothetical protein
MFASLLVVAALFNVANADFVIDTNTLASTLVGCGVGGPSAAIAGAGQSGVGAIVDLYDSKEGWTKHPSLVQTGLLMDAAMSADSKISLVTSICKVFISTDNSETFAPIPGVCGPVQGAYVFDEHSVALVGNTISSNGGTAGLTVSTDGAGKVWNSYKVNDEQYPRYGAFPSADTWFIAAGMWGEDTVNSTMHSVSHRVKANKLDAKLHMKLGGAADTTTGWYGEIYKTTDAGATFTSVYSSPSDALWYFNQISCGSESFCIASAEGYSNDGTAPYALLLQTTDGGSTWTTSWESSTAISMMANKMISATEGWFAAGVQGAQRSLQTQFYYTSDAGVSWTLKQTLDGCLTMDLDFSADGALGVATCVNNSGTQMELATYTA